MQLLEIFKDKDVLKKLEHDVFYGGMPVIFSNKSATKFNQTLSEFTESYLIPIIHFKEKEYYPYLYQTIENFYKQNNRPLHLELCKILIYPSSFDGLVHCDNEDDKDTLTTITFLNSDWDVSWGGEIICYSPDLKMVIGGATPQFGKTFVFNGRLPHRALAPIRLSSLLRIVLVTKEL